MYSDHFEGGPAGNPEFDNNDDANGSRDADAGGCPDTDDTGSDEDRRGRFTLEEVTNLDEASQYDTVRPCDIKGILHAHSRYTDGSHTLGSMVETARQIGLEYLGVSDHYRSINHQCGLDAGSARVQRQEIDILRSKFADFDILHGVEVDANPDGTLPVDEGTLMFFDYVIVSFPENGGYDMARLTEQVVRIAAHPLVNILGRPIGDCMLRCNNDALDMERVLTAAAEGCTALEVNANPNTLQLDWKCCRQAQDMGVYLSISPDAHRAARLVDYRHGTELAGDAGLCCASILNTLSARELRDYLKLAS